MLHQLHVNNCTHLDIKPTNIQWLLIDFGCAKYINPSIGYTASEINIRIKIDQILSLKILTFEH